MTKYIAIEGKGGSGKTYLSELLAERLGAPVFHLDDCGDDYKPFIGLPRLREVVAEASEPVVIYEGVGVFDERLDDLKPYRILVHIPEEIRQKRVDGRDVPRDGCSVEDWQDIWAIWDQAEAGYFTKETADEADLVAGMQDGDFDIDDIVTKLTEADIL